MTPVATLRGAYSWQRLWSHTEFPRWWENSALPPGTLTTWRWWSALSTSWPVPQRLPGHCETRRPYGKRPWRATSSPPHPRSCTCFPQKGHQAIWAGSLKKRQQQVSWRWWIRCGRTPTFLWPTSSTLPRTMRGNANHALTGHLSTTSLLYTTSAASPQTLTPCRSVLRTREVTFTFPASPPYISN